MDKRLACSRVEPIPLFYASGMTTSTMATITTSPNSQSREQGGCQGV